MKSIFINKKKGKIERDRKDKLTNQYRNAYKSHTKNQDIRNNTNVPPRP